MTSQSISVGDWLKISVQRLHEVSESPQLDAEILLAAITGIHRATAYAHPEQLLTAEQIEDLHVVLVRRERGEPIAYLTGRQEFWSLPLYVSPAVLIPRPDTERLVERALELISLEQPMQVLDLGTGSGAVALAIAQARPHAQVLAIDISETALTVAQSNLRSVGVRNLELRQSDWFSALGAMRFDIIVSNPPYVAADDPNLCPHVAQFEPQIAVVSGPSGLEAIEHIISGAFAHLITHGWLLLEHGWQQGSRVRALLVQHGYSHVRSHTDLSGHERITEGRLSAHP